MSTAAQKSESAFRTISEVAEELNVQQHVLRFWETKFGQIKPLKRGGGRRYYRPEDVALLKKIYSLLYVEGYTIKGVQKLLKGVSKSQVLEEQRAEAAQSATQAYGDNLPQVQGPAAAALAAIEFEDGTPATDAEAFILPPHQVAAPAAPGLTAVQRQALEAVLDELVDMREQLRSVMTKKAPETDAA